MTFVTRYNPEILRVIKEGECFITFPFFIGVTSNKPPLEANGHSPSAFHLLSTRGS